MGQMRVHELAKELGLVSRDLLQKIENIGFSDKKPQSGLAKKEVEQIKAFLDSAGEKSLKLEESRISGGVIRRRRKIVKEEIVDEASAIEETLPVETAAAEEKPTVRKRKPKTLEPVGLKRIKLADEDTAGLPEKDDQVAKKDSGESREDPRYKRLRVLKRGEEAEEQIIIKEKKTVKDKNLGKKLEVLQSKTDDILADKKLPKPKIEVVDMKSFPTQRGFRPRRRQMPRTGKGKKTEITTPKAIKRVLKMDEMIIISDFAKKIGVKAGEVIGKLMSMGTMVTINQTIDFETAQILAAEFDWEVESVAINEVDIFSSKTDAAGDLTARAPVVTVMGHVDHGKTKLLDAIRSTNVIDAEAGGITQHIGASEVEVKGKKIVFLDTPGHEAFTTLRARGAQITDIVILIVAADDGVMPQTKEAINHAKAAKVPIIVVINKIDKPEANPDRVMQQLSEFELIPEEWGGETIFARTSAKQGQGIAELLDLVLLQAEMMELRANADKPAVGTIIEARLDRGRGPVASVLVQEGQLKVGDTVISGVHIGKIRALLNTRGEAVKEVGPSSAVEVIGLHGVPQSGDPLNVVADEKKAKQFIEGRQSKAREVDLASSSKVSLEDLYQKIEDGQVKELKVVLKADVVGSIEALNDAFKKLSGSKVKISTIHQAVGGITEGDVLLASASDAIVVGFNVRPDSGALTVAEKEGVQIKLYSIIYEAVDELRQAMEGMLEPVFKEIVNAKLLAKEIFVIPKVGTIAGCLVESGKILRKCKVRVVREGVVIYTGNISSLRRFQNDAKEVEEGLECGLGVEKYNDIKVGDVLEAFTLEEEKVSLD